MKQSFSAYPVCLHPAGPAAELAEGSAVEGCHAGRSPRKGLNCTKTVSEKAKSSQLVMLSCAASCSGRFREIPSLVLNLVKAERSVCLCR